MRAICAYATPPEAFILTQFASTSLLALLVASFALYTALYYKERVRPVLPQFTGTRFALLLVHGLD